MSRLFCICANEDENLRGQGGSTRAKRENVASATARRASHAVASNLYHRPNLKSLLNEQAFLHLWFCSPGKQSAAGVVILKRISPSPRPSPQRGEGENQRDLLAWRFGWRQIFTILCWRAPNRSPHSLEKRPGENQCGLLAWCLGERQISTILC